MPPKGEGKRAVVYWTKDEKAGIEPVNNIPASARFEGSITPVQFSGDKKWYPAKVIMISDDTEALTLKEEEIAQSIMEQKKQNANPVTRTRKVSKTRVVANVASEREVALALGTKPPMPRHLEDEQKAAVRVKKDARDHHRKAQGELDGKVSDKIKKMLFASTASKVSQENVRNISDDEEEDFLHSTSDNEVVEGSGNEDTGDERGGESNDENLHEIEELASKPKWCDCVPCSTLQKYDNPTYLCFLKDIIKLYDDVNEQDPSSRHKYLKLKPLPEGVRQVELTTGSGIFIPLSVKDQLKVDHKNRPSSLVRETLFALYGQQPFRTLSITARGNKMGTYGVEENVLKAVTAFVNRHVQSEKKLKMTDVVATINKRAQEWRKTPSPKQEGKTHKKKVLLKSKVISTSPFKVVKLTPSVHEVATPKKSFVTPSKSPATSIRCTPRKQVSPSKLPPTSMNLTEPARPAAPYAPPYFQSHYPSYAPHPSPSPFYSQQETQQQWNNSYWPQQHTEQPSWQAWSREQASAPESSFTNL